jgi:hypothetical protein
MKADIDGASQGSGDHGSSAVATAVVTSQSVEGNDIAELDEMSSPLEPATPVEKKRKVEIETPRAVAAPVSQSGTQQSAGNQVADRDAGMKVHLCIIGKRQVGHFHRLCVLAGLAGEQPITGAELGMEVAVPAGRLRGMETVRPAALRLVDEYTDWLVSPGLRQISALDMFVSEQYNSDEDTMEACVFFYYGRCIRPTPGGDKCEELWQLRMRTASELVQLVGQDDCTWRWPLNLLCKFRRFPGHNGQWLGARTWLELQVVPRVAQERFLQDREGDRHGLPEGVDNIDVGFENPVGFPEDPPSGTLLRVPEVEENWPIHRANPSWQAGQ